MIAPNPFIPTRDEKQIHDDPAAELAMRQIMRSRRDFLERLWPVVLGRRVLEVVCGPAQELLPFVRRGAQITAVDFLQSSLNQTQHLYNKIGYSVETARADLRDLPFDDGRFDLVLNVGLFNRCADHQLDSALDEMIRVVRPGGQILAFCPTTRHCALAPLPIHRLRHHHDEPPRVLTAKHLHRQFKSRGLESVKMSGINLYPVTQGRLPRWLRYRWIESSSRWSCRWLENLNACHGVKARIGREFVVWATVPRLVATEKISVPSPDTGPVNRNESNTDARRAA